MVVLRSRRPRDRGYRGRVRRLRPEPASVNFSQLASTSLRSCGRTANSLKLTSLTCVCDRSSDCSDLIPATCSRSESVNCSQKERSRSPSVNPQARRPCDEPANDPRRRSIPCCVESPGAVTVANPDATSSAPRIIPYLFAIGLAFYVRGMAEDLDNHRLRLALDGLKPRQISLVGPVVQRFGLGRVWLHRLCRKCVWLLTAG